MRFLGFAAIALGFASVSALDSDSPPGRSADQAALKPYAGLVGEWRGTGQVRRNSARGAWTESAAWAWKLSKDSAGLEVKLDKDRYLKSAVLRPGKEKGSFVLEAMLVDGTKRQFTGKAGARDQLALVAEGKTTDEVARVTLTPLHDTRFLMLLEARDPDSSSFHRLGEVGYTRQGVAFAAGDSYPVCIVTEGRGTIPVTYKGKTYYVCCSGCKSLFDEDPAGVMAEYEKKKAEKDKKP
jgi:YHS domain-containing protein